MSASTRRLRHVQSSLAPLPASAELPPLPTWQLGTGPRDFEGYGISPPNAAWPNGAKVAVSFVLNIEEGSERAWTRGDGGLHGEKNEQVYDMIEAIDGQANLTMESHMDYGPRAGYWRVAKLLEKHGATATANICAEAVQLYPALGRDLVARGFEISCHGRRWETPLGLTEEEERKWITDSVAAIESVCGVRPVGWHCRCPHTVNTRRLLIEEGGFIYDSDAYDDDLPRFFADTPSDRSQPHVILPYSLDTNDMRYQLAAAGFPTATQFTEYCCDAFDWLWDEVRKTRRLRRFYAKNDHFTKTGSGQT